MIPWDLLIYVQRCPLYFGLMLVACFGFLEVRTGLMQESGIAMASAVAQAVFEVFGIVCRALRREITMQRCFVLIHGPQTWHEMIDPSMVALAKTSKKNKS
ncbi:hypothetical protein ml_112 [Mollivirus sibericum]|uniref:hypothetical protein n=1 Tax=Mollivirus sibericum TaxID=1678078 RepID=UPI0006B2E478|nr:hypothetical protein ml_112 [Mollivirus sibericum]ALD61914.1 hypothetical protein ml_112 [Mollivirus sibericum]